MTSEWIVIDLVDLRQAALITVVEIEIFPYVDFLGCYLFLMFVYFLV